MILRPGVKCHIGGQLWQLGIKYKIHHLNIDEVSFELTFAETVVGEVWVQPAIFRRAGITNRLNVTAADTGLPGNANTSLVLPSLSTVAKVVGFLCEK